MSALSAWWGDLKVGFTLARQRGRTQWNLLTALGQVLQVASWSCRLMAVAAGIISFLADTTELFGKFSESSSASASLSLQISTPAATLDCNRAGGGWLFSPFEKSSWDALQEPYTIKNDAFGEIRFRSRVIRVLNEITQQQARNHRTVSGLVLLGAADQTDIVKGAGKKVESNPQLAEKRAAAILQEFRNRWKGTLPAVQMIPRPAETVLAGATEKETAPDRSVEVCVLWQ